MHPTSRATKAVTDGWIALEDEEGEEEEGGDDEAMLALFEEEEDGDTDVESDSDSPDEIFELFQLKKNMQQYCVQNFQYIFQLMFDFKFVWTTCKN